MSRGVAAPRRLRAPVVVGTFYPAEPAALRDTVDRLLTAATPPQLSGPPKAIIVPHAGYIYSGPIAATAYRAIEPRRHDIERVVLLGPAHRVLLRGMAIATVDAFATPLGEIPIDDEARQQALTFAGVVADDVPHADEHALEVQLPFLQRVIEAGRIIKGAAGMAGELGHVHIPMHGLLLDGQPLPRCNCGFKGDAESVASLSGIRNNLLPFWLTKYPDHPLAELDPLDAAKQVRTYGEHGDEMARRLFDQQAMALGRLFTIAANFTDPDAYFVGGGVIETAPEFRDWFRDRVVEYTELRDEQRRVAKFELVADLDMAGARGAAIAALSVLVHTT